MSDLYTDIMKQTSFLCKLSNNKITFVLMLAVLYNVALKFDFLLKKILNSINFKYQSSFKENTKGQKSRSSKRQRCPISIIVASDLSTINNFQVGPEERPSSVFMNSPRDVDVEDDAVLLTKRAQVSNISYRYRYITTYHYIKEMRN